MRLSSNPYALTVYKNNRLSQFSLLKSMKRLSSGTRLERPGDSPVEYGLLQTLQSAINNSRQAKKNMGNARSFLGTADAYLETTEGQLRRMMELTVHALDSTKNASDRAILQKEFDILKRDISKSARDMKINDYHFLSRDQILSYDKEEKTFFFSDLDGENVYRLPRPVLSGLEASNGKDFLFSANQDFTLSHDGKYIFYVDGENSLVRYDIENNLLRRDDTDNNDKSLHVDNEGRLWVASEISSGVYSLGQQDIELWQEDTEIIQNNDISDMASSEFSIYRDRIYYLNTSGDIVSRSIIEKGDLNVDVLSSDLDDPIKNNPGQFTISQDGKYVIDMPTSHALRIIDTRSNHSSKITLSSAFSVGDMTMSADNFEVLFIDQNSQAMYKLELDTQSSKDTALFKGTTRLHAAPGSSGFAGLSVDGGSQLGRMLFHTGPQHGHFERMELADLRLYSLGISRLELNSELEIIEAASVVREAVDVISRQRAAIGNKMTNLAHAEDSLDTYTNFLSEGYHRIHDVDFAKESSQMASEQIGLQATSALLAQANQIPRYALNLLSS